MRRRRDLPRGRVGRGSGGSREASGAAPPSRSGRPGCHGCGQRDRREEPGRRSARAETSLRRPGRSAVRPPPLRPLPPDGGQALGGTVPASLGSDSGPPPSPGSPAAPCRGEAGQSLSAASASASSRGSRRRSFVPRPAGGGSCGCPSDPAALRPWGTPQSRQVRGCDWPGEACAVLNAREPPAEPAEGRRLGDSRLFLATLPIIPNRPGIRGSARAQIPLF